MAQAITPACTCLTCGRPTTRLYGVGAGLVLADGSGVRAKGEAIGYCLNHRDVVLKQWRAALEELGEIEWISEGDEVADLRPAEVQDFLARADELFMDVLPQGDSTNPGKCPHCGGDVSWGTGPHVADAAQRRGATAWECASCGAAGMYLPH